MNVNHGIAFVMQIPLYLRPLLSSTVSPFTTWWLTIQLPTLLFCVPWFFAIGVPEIVLVLLPLIVST